MQNMNVLVVDDEQDIVKVIQARLESKGCKVRVAYNGKEALNKVKEEIPDLIVLDVMMPVLSGYDVCTTLKFNALYKDIPILLLTARNEEIDPRVSSMMGISYMQKPFDSEVFWAKIEQIVKVS